MPVKIVDSHTRRALSIRQGEVKAVIVHTTGETNHEKILSFYRSPTGYQPHYYIQQNGTIHMTARESLVAYHCAVKPVERELYAKGYSSWSHYLWTQNDMARDMGSEQANYALWRDTWLSDKVRSPLDLVTGMTPNSVSIGVELQALPEKHPVVFYDSQYQALAELCGDIEKRHSLRLSRDTLLGHYDCSPMRRSNRNGSTDPGSRFSFKRVIDAVRTINDGE